MTEIKNETGIGQIQIADEVISVIAGTACMEIEGVSGMSGNFGDWSELLGRKNFSKGVKVVVEENNVTVDITILVRIGYRVQDVSQGIQKRVKNAIETMTGLSVTAVNVVVAGVLPEKEKLPETV